MTILRVLMVLNFIACLVSTITWLYYVTRCARDRRNQRRREWLAQQEHSS